MLSKLHAICFRTVNFSCIHLILQLRMSGRYFPLPLHKIVSIRAKLIKHVGLQRFSVCVREYIILELSDIEQGKIKSYISQSHNVLFQLFRKVVQIPFLIRFFGSHCVVCYIGCCGHLESTNDFCQISFQRQDLRKWCKI